MYQSETFLRPREHRGLHLNILIADLHRRATLLEADIRAEEERAHAFHSSNPTVLALHQTAPRQYPRHGFAFGRSASSRRSMIKKGWSRAFDEEIVLPDGRTLVTLRDAGEYMAALPPLVQKMPQWRTAVAALMMVVDTEGPTLLARIAMVRALNSLRQAGA